MNSTKDVITAPHDKRLDDVVSFLSEGLDIPRARINRLTPLREGLNIDGDDAEELLSVFAEEFKVDISRFRFSDYFGEPLQKPPLLSFWLVLFGNAKKAKTLKVYDLVRAIERGYLV